MVAYRPYPEEVGFLQFYRPGSTGSSVFYYTLFRVDISIAGLYTFRALSSSDSYGYLYVNHFNASNPEADLIAFNDDYGSDMNFRITGDLNGETEYYLVLTWLNPYTRDGYATVYITGPADATVHIVNGT